MAEIIEEERRVRKREQEKAKTKEQLANAQALTYGCIVLYCIDFGVLLYCIDAGVRHRARHGRICSGILQYWTARYYPR